MSMKQPLFPSTIGTQSHFAYFLTVKAVVRKFGKSDSQTGSWCLDKAVLVRGGGEGGALPAVLALRLKPHWPGYLQCAKKKTTQQHRSDNSLSDLSAYMGLPRELGSLGWTRGICDCLHLSSPLCTPHLTMSGDNPSRVHIPSRVKR